MNQHLPYPTSFPNRDEISFLKMVLADDAVFPIAWDQWKSSHVFEDITDPILHLLPLVYLRMDRLGLHNDLLFGRIKGVYKNAWIKNQRLLAVTKQVLQICSQNNISTLFLKGIPLIYDVYQDLGARFLGDADFLVSPEHARTITKAMLENGWHYHKPWMIDAKNPCESIFKVIKATTFSNNFGVDMDIHWNLFALTHHTRLRDIFLLKPVSSIIYRTTFWNDAVPLVMGTMAVQRLSNEDLLIHVVIHGSEGNNYRTIRWVTDAVSIITKLPIHWNSILDRARNFGFALELSLAFRFLADQFPEIIPVDFLISLQSIPVSDREIKKYYRFTNISHTNRFSAFGNFPMIWYAYWNYESATTIVGFLRFIKKSFGVTTVKELFHFVFKKYIMRFKKLFPM